MIQEKGKGMIEELQKNTKLMYELLNDDKYISKYWEIQGNPISPILHLKVNLPNFNDSNNNNNNNNNNANNLNTQQQLQQQSQQKDEMKLETGFADTSVMGGDVSGTGGGGASGASGGTSVGVASGVASGMSSNVGSPNREKRPRTSSFTRKRKPLPYYLRDEYKYENIWYEQIHLRMREKGVLIYPNVYLPQEYGIAEKTNPKPSLRICITKDHSKQQIIKCVQLLKQIIPNVINDAIKFGNKVCNFVFLWFFLVFFFCFFFCVWFCVCVCVCGFVLFCAFVCVCVCVFFWWFKVYGVKRT